VFGFKSMVIRGGGGPSPHRHRPVRFKPVVVPVCNDSFSSSN